MRSVLVMNLDSAMNWTVQSGELVRLVGLQRGERVTWNNIAGELEDSRWARGGQAAKEDVHFCEWKQSVSLDRQTDRMLIKKAAGPLHP